MVRCEKVDSCPERTCPHYEEHSPYRFSWHIGGNEDKYTDCTEGMMCGLVKPYKEVRCAEVIKDIDLKRELVYNPV